MPGAKLSSTASILRPPKASIVTDGRLAHAHPADLRLLEIGDEVDVLHRHDRHQPGARLHELADANALIADPARRWRARSKRVAHIDLGGFATCAWAA